MEELGFNNQDAKKFVGETAKVNHDIVKLNHELKMKLQPLLGTQSLDNLAKQGIAADSSDVLMLFKEVRRLLENVRWYERTLYKAVLVSLTDPQLVLSEKIEFGVMGPDDPPEDPPD